jgi:hypothetical protein
MKNLPLKQQVQNLHQQIQRVTPSLLPIDSKANFGIPSPAKLSMTQPVKQQQNGPQKQQA